MIAYASRTGTRRNLDALRLAGWRLMLSPAGELRTEGFPNYALDNGAWSAFSQKSPWDEGAFTDALDRFGSAADFVVAPDVVCGGVGSLDLSLTWLDRVLARTQVAMIAVQNGMTPNHLSGMLGPRVGVFVGGDDEWKEATCGMWATTAHAAGAVCHVGRVNTRRRLRIISMGGADSFDGSGASKWVKHLNRMERWLCQPTFCFRGVSYAISA